MSDAGYPNFLIIGAMKSGTTSLYRYLQDHPQVFMPWLKSPNFFIDPNDLGEAPGKRTDEWYRSLFADARAEHTARGEASTGYTKWPVYDGVPRRISERIPNARLIYVVRHPIERIRSQYVHWSLEHDLPPIDEAVLADPRYVQFSSYATQLERYLSHFDPQQILVIRAEDLDDARSGTLRRVFTFLGVDPEWQTPTQQERFHLSTQRLVTRPAIERLRRVRAYRALTGSIPTSWKVALDRRTRMLRRAAPPVDAVLSPAVVRELENRLRGEIERLATFMEPDFDGWGIVRRADQR